MTYVRGRLFEKSEFSELCPHPMAGEWRPYVYISSMTTLQSYIAVSGMHTRLLYNVMSTRLQLS